MIFAFILAGSATIFAQNGPLTGTEWKLVAANGRAVTNSTASIEISDEGTRFTGNTGCNQMFGSLVVKGRLIDFQNIGATKRTCKLMAGNVAENLFLKALKNSARYSQTNGNLRLTDRRGRTILRFTRERNEQQNSTRLHDRKWVLEQIKGRQTFVPLPYAFVNFDSVKRNVGGNSGCNVFGGAYKANGKSIAFSNIISTMRACIEDNKMAVERDMLDGLRSARSFAIRDGRLFLYRGNQVLLTFRGKDK